MEFMTQEEVRTLEGIGFELVSQDSHGMKFYHGECDFEIHVYHSYIKDPYQGVYMEISREQTSFKKYRGKNAVKNIKKFMEQYRK